MRLLAIGLTAAAILAVSVRETAPGRQHDLIRSSPRLDDIHLFEEINAWLDPAAALGRGPNDQDAKPFHEKVRGRRESFDLFIDAADDDAVHREVRLLPFGEQILVVAEQNDIDPLLVAAVVATESTFDAEAVSPRGALGLMQVMPATAKRFGVSDATDPLQNLGAGVRYLKLLLRRFDGDLALALAAYNAGPGAVIRFGGIPPYRETLGFVDTVLRRYVEHHRRAWTAVNPGGLDFAVLAGG